MAENYDVVVVGGGAAGLSGAVALGRFRRSVLLIDAGDPRNAASGHVHNFLTRDDVAPSEIHRIGHEELAKYGVIVETGEVSAITGDVTDGFSVVVDDRMVNARRILIASGARDELPAIAGLAERWGRDVIHCPYCHGWEVRDQRIGLLMTSPLVAHVAPLYRQLSDRITLLQHTSADLSDEQLEQFDALGITVVPSEVLEVLTERDALSGVRLADGSVVEVDALAVATRVYARIDALAPLGLSAAPVEFGGHVVGTQVEVDATGATSVPGVWAAGNVANVQAQVVSSAAAGLAAGAAINADLVAADSAHAVQELRYDRLHSQHAWEERYQARPRNWSGRPNAALVQEISGVTPGRALDVGAGEGADAIWLAQQGWRVTGIDISPTALERAAEESIRAGVEVDWRHLDLMTQDVPGSFDLVSAFFFHLPPYLRVPAFARLAAAVVPGGTLLIVGHDFSDLETSMPRHHLRDMGWTPAELAEDLGAGWTIAVAETRPRTAVDPDGNHIEIADAVVRARRAL